MTQKQDIRRSRKILQALFISVVVILAIEGVIYINEFTGYAFFHTGDAGTITHMTIDYRPAVDSWAGIAGITVMVQGVNLNQTQIMTGGQIEDENYIFDCLPSGEDNELFSSIVPEEAINFATLVPATAADVDTYLGLDSGNLQSATRTLTTTMSISLGTTSISNIPATYTYVSSTSGSTAFPIGVLKDGDGDLLWVTILNENFTQGFDNEIKNFQMILPVPNGTTPLYHFFVDPNNDCPEGVGELPTQANVTGIVTTELGVPIENAIVTIGGESTLTDVLGNYSLTTAIGFQYVFAVADGFNNYVNNLTVVANTTNIHNIVMEEEPEIPEETLTDVGPDIDSGPDDNPDVGPFQVPPVIEEPKEIEGTDYIISLSEIVRKIKEDNFLQERIFFISFKDSTAEVNLELTGNATELIEIDKESFFINPRSQEFAIVTIFGRRSRGIYNGTLDITGDLNATIPIEIEVLPKSQLPVEALVLDVDINKKEALPGQFITVKTDLSNMLTDRAYPVRLIYTIQDAKGKDTIWSFETNVFLKTASSLLKDVKLPTNLNAGNYILSVTAFYLDLTASKSAVFEVGVPILQKRIFGRVPVWVIIVSIVSIAALVGGYLYWRRVQESKKKFHIKVDYNELPKPGPRSIFVGKIAETDKKTYFNLENFKTHTIVAGSTGGGKSFSAQGIIEEMLLKDVAILCFDPTAQWTGMLRKMSNKAILSLYPEFGMKKSQAQAFNGNIRQIMNKREIIDIKKYMKPGEIQVFACHRLDPKDMDIFCANVIREVFHANFDESAKLRLMLVFDEVHRLLPKFGGSGDGFLQIERACREFRKWGIGVMLISQVLADFMGQIKANINTEIQMRTRDDGDLERIRVKYGEDVLRSLVKASIGAGMVENPAYNRGKPYFVQFRPLLHSIERLNDDDIEQYNKYNFAIDDLFYSLEQLEKEGIDVFDLKLELKLALDKVKSGNFNMVDIYLEGLKPRIQKHWTKLGKEPKKYELKTVSEEDLQEALKKAKESREEYEKKQAKDKPKEEDKGDSNDPAALFKKDVAPDKVLNLKNGMIVINLNSLYDEISAMKDNDYGAEVDDSHNSFATWVRDAIGDNELADHIENAEDKAAVINLLDLKKKGEKLPALVKKEKKPAEGEKKEGEGDGGEKKEGDGEKKDDGGEKKEGEEEKKEGEDGEKKENTDGDGKKEADSGEATEEKKDETPEKKDEKDDVAKTEDEKKGEEEKKDEG